MVETADGGIGAIETGKFYRSEWPLDKLLEARVGGLVIDDGEAWRYQYSHKDAQGEYDLLYRPTRTFQTISPKQADVLARAYLASVELKHLPIAVGQAETEKSVLASLVETLRWIAANDRSGPMLFADNGHGRMVPQGEGAGEIASRANAAIVEAEAAIGGRCDRHEALGVTVKALEDIIGCFDAARCEGLIEQLSDQTIEVGNLADLVQRRLAFAETYARDALDQVRKPVAA